MLSEFLVISSHKRGGFVIGGKKGPIVQAVLVWDFEEHCEAGGRVRRPGQATPGVTRDSRLGVH